MNRLSYHVHLFLCALSLSIASSVAFSDDCEKILTILSSITATQRGNPNSLNSPHHPEYLRAKLPPQPKLKYRAISYHRAEVKAAQPAISDEHYLAVEGDRPYVYKVHPRTQKLEPVKNTFDSVKNVEKALAWGPNRTLVAVERDGSISILRLHPEENILNFLSKFETGGKITVDPVWGPDNTMAVATQEQNKNYLLLLRFTPETGGVELVEKHEMPELITANIVRPDGTLASIGSNGHLSIFKINTPANKLDLLDQTQLPSKIKAKPSWGPDHMLAVPGQDGRLFALQLNPQTQKIEIKYEFQTGGQLQWGSPDWGPNNMIAFVGKNQNPKVVRLNPETKKLESIDIPEVPESQSAAWGPEGTLAVAGSGGLYVFKMNPQTRKMDLVDKFNPRDGFYMASLAWGPNATVIVNSLTGTYSFKLADGRSWHTFLSEIIHRKD